MKKLIGMFLLVLSGGAALAQNKVQCREWEISEPQQLYMPVFASEKSVDGKTFDRATLLEKAQQEATDIKNWQTVSIDDSLIVSVNKANQLVQLKGFLSSDRWVKTKLNVSTNAVFELYFDEKKVKTQGTVSSKPITIDLTSDNGKHQLLFKLISTGDSLRFASNVQTAGDSCKAVLSWNTDPKRFVTIHDILDGEQVYASKISPSGKYLILQLGTLLPESGKTKEYFRVYDLEQKKNIFMSRSGSLRANWMPQTDRLSYTVSNDDESDVYVYDLTSGEEKRVASGIKKLGMIRWSPNEDYFIFSRQEEAEKTGDLKRVFGNDDRIPGFRDRSYLYYFKLKTGIAMPLTAGAQSAWLQDIKPDGSRILFSTSRMDYTEVPFSKQNLYEMDLSSFQTDTIWKNKLYDGWCQYSPDGNQLLVSGAPECFGNMGVKVSKGRIPNSYDKQLYLFDLKTRKAETLTRDFDPSIDQAYWAKNGTIYLTVNEHEYVNLYRFDLQKKDFTKIDVPTEVISNIDYASEKPFAVFSGSSISSPEKLFTLDLSNGKSDLLLFPKKEQFADIKFGKNETWNFVNKNGTTIYGSIYYPANYDPAKKYPLIVYYYGGTTPTERNFGGRYPKNTWAARGYMVYVVQPSGAIGFGQDFSALHVNGWGRDAIDDIIDGTKKFLTAHPSADAENVGCIGASYGGFTTMMLQTRTNIFKTAIAHAGISSISSYWGEGYWGYSYSSGATKFSYPWNRKDIYVDNSPLFNADKFRNSILLLHGTADTNVPVGESLQYYAALKILGKDVEMVLIDGENHHILDYSKRLKWHDTILAWFDKKLKDQPDEWNEMYPDKNL